jgi:hypothetical protein
MADRKQERQLLGYLLAALDESERVRIERQLARNPALREKLTQAEESLEVLRSVPRAFRPPEGLAARTCRRVFAYAEALAGQAEGARTVSPAPRQRARAMSPAAVPPSSTATWGWSDLVVAVAVFLAVTCSIFPALQRSRMIARTVACQDNLRQIGLTQAQYHDLHDDGAGSAPAGREVAMAGLPLAFFLNQGGMRGFAAARPARPAPQCAAPLSLPAAPRPLFGHQGFSGSVRGQNLLFLDGRAVFMTMGPAVDPSDDGLDHGDPWTPAWPDRTDAPANGPNDFAPIVLIGRPLP